MPTPPTPLPFTYHRYSALKPGPKVIITGAVHGNEICGTLAIKKCMAQLEYQELRLTSGSVTFVPITNPLAYAQQQRGGDRNLNRNLHPQNPPIDFEDHVANWLCPLLSQHDVLVDLHSYLAPGTPFVFIGPENNNGSLEPFQQAEEEQALAQRLGVERGVHGWLSTYALGVKRRQQRLQGQHLHQAQLSMDPCYGVGTTEYMRQCGGWAVTLECGQHSEPEAPQIAYQAIINTLSYLGLLDLPSPPANRHMEWIELYDVLDKEHEADHFSHTWASFDPVQQGQIIGYRANGQPITATEDGYIVFPNQNSIVNQEWFYLARPSRRL